MTAKKSLIGFVAALSCALALAAEVMPISNFGTGDRPMLVPRVQQYRAEAGALKLPELLTVSVTEPERT